MNTINEITYTISKYVYNAMVTEVYDGDGKFEVTLKIIVDIGMRELVTITRNKELRVYGIDTPELRSGDKRHNAAGKIVRDFVKDLILDKEVIITTHKDKRGKYGRLLADVTLSDGRDLATVLLEKKYAKPFSGRTRKTEWTPEDIDFIIDSIPSEE